MGSGQTVYTDDLSQPLVLHLTQQGSDVEGITLSVTPQAGAASEPASVATDSNGQAALALRAGRQPGTEVFTVSASLPDGGSLGPVGTVSVDVTPPPAGTLFIVANVSGTSGVQTTPQAATEAQLALPQGLVAAADGTLYVSDRTGWVRSIDPAGTIRVVAGDGSNVDSGDHGQATAAGIDNPTELALSPDGTTLYVAELYRLKIRAVNLTTGIITTFAGGGSAGSPDYGDNGLATSAAFLDLTAMAVGPDNALYVVDALMNRIRRIDPISHLITKVYEGSGFNVCPTGTVLTVVGAGLAWDAQGQTFLGGTFCDPLLGAFGGIARVNSDGSLTMVAGKDISLSVTGGSALTTAFNDRVRFAFDTAGNLFTWANNYNTVQRIDGTSSAVTLVAGNGQADSAADFVPAVSAPLNSIQGLAIDGQNRLYLAEYAGHDLRAVEAAGSAAPVPTLLAQPQGGALSALVDAVTAPMAVTLTQSGAALPGTLVFWRRLDLGAGTFDPLTWADATGTATEQGRPGLAPGDYRFEARVRDLHGNDVSGSPATFTVTATAPAAGTIFTVADSAHAVGDGTNGFDGGAATFVSLAQLWGPVVADPAGGFYVAEGNLVAHVSAAGEYQLVAGNGQDANSGDNGPATQASIRRTASLALDPSGNALYVATAYGAVIRRVDLNTGIITTYAGGGTAGAPGYGNGGPATDATIPTYAGVGPIPMAVGPDHTLFFVDDSGQNNASVLRKVDPVTHTVSAAFSGITGAFSYYVSSFYPMAFGADGNLYIYGSCGTATTSGFCVAQFDGAGNYVQTSVGGFGSSVSDGDPVSSTYLGSVTAMTLGANGDVYYGQVYSGGGGTQPANYWVRRIDHADLTVHTVAGTTQGDSGDWGPATAAQFGNYPAGLAITSDGHLLVVDDYNYAVREVW